MNKKSIAVLVGAGILCVILLAIAFGGGSGNSEPDVRYNYDSTASHGFKSIITGNEIKPAEGNIFIIVTIHAYNDKGAAVPLNSLIWSWKVQAAGIEYSISTHTYSHPMHGTGSLAVGGDARFVLVFEIPYTSNYAVLEEFDFGKEKIKRDLNIIV